MGEPSVRYVYPLLRFEDATGWIDLTTPRLVLDHPSEYPANVNVQLTALPAGGSLASAVAEAEAGLLTELPGAQVEERGSTTVDGQPAELRLARYEVALGGSGQAAAPGDQGLAVALAWRALQVYALRDGVLYTVTFTALAEELLALRPAFERLVAGLRLP